ncbi:hypothetical protein [Companilactobacillus ginsenosidimutans]|uniref:Uncharacterized protein n=1 Tax=Companilactobacillus ginsenosidimutans TaxID=1007676 RepID=A0A0H4QHS0_9LACO|nr:hypothetical protein [Companilactobacillus ginsenosidimutans]AKP67497.1 hypothetical protein ABM34_08125 [Companilactobacillus ginsenosidimutans]
MFQLSADSVIISALTYENLKINNQHYSDKVKKYQSVVGEFILRIGNLEDTVEELQNENSQLRNLLEDKKAELAAEHAQNKFSGKFRVSESRNSNLTDEARGFISSLKKKFGTDCKLVHEYIDQNYHENISVKTIRKICGE